MRESDETSGEMNTREAKPCEEGEALLLRHRLKANFGFSFFLSFPDYSDYSYERRDFDSRAWNSMEFLYFFFFFGDELAVIPFFTTSELFRAEIICVNF